IPAHDRDDEWPAAEQARGPAVKTVRVMHMHDIGPAAEQKAHKPDNPKKMAQRFAAHPAATSCERPPPAAIGESRVEAGDQLGDARDTTPAQRWRYQVDVVAHIGKAADPRCHMHAVGLADRANRQPFPRRNTRAASRTRLRRHNPVAHRQISGTTIQAWPAQRSCWMNPPDRRHGHPATAVLHSGETGRAPSAIAKSAYRARKHAIRAASDRKCTRL